MFIKVYVLTLQKQSPYVEVTDRASEGSSLAHSHLGFTSLLGKVLPRVVL